MHNDRRRHFFSFEEVFFASFFLAAFLLSKKTRQETRGVKVYSMSFSVERGLTTQE